MVIQASSPGIYQIVATGSRCSCVLLPSVNINGQSGRDDSRETRRGKRFQHWHNICEWLAGMKTVYTEQPGRVRAEIVASIVLSFGIIVAMVVPATRPVGAPGFSEGLFTVTEGDYSSPLLSSARVIKVLNVAAREVARFAGYDDFATRVEFSNKISVVSVTRYSGDLLNLLNVGFIAGETSNLWTLPIYISEAFWDRAFGRDENIRGQQVKIHDVTYTIAGVTRDFRGMLSGTEIWLPIGNIRKLQTIPSMRIVGALNPSTSWTGAQNALSKCFVQFLGDHAYSEREGAKLVPLQKGMEMTDLPVLAGNATSRVLAAGS